MSAGNDSGGESQVSPAELALQIYNLLIDRQPDVRQRVLSSVMTLLGDQPLSSTAQSPVSMSVEGLDELSLGPRALKWIQRNGLSREMLEEVFHLSDSEKEIIASEVPGASRREMTANCYLLSGIRGLLRQDTPTLDETETIAVCKRLAAYDKNNHTVNRNSVGNRMSGTKPTFTLTGPGELAAAELVKQMTAPGSA
jgi:hypothetical protein